MGNMDVIIVGGGFVGSTLSIALSEVGLSVALVESVNLREAIQSEFDGRSFAVSLSNQRLLKTIGIWAGLENNASPILDIRISDGPSLLFLHYDHREVGDEPMGYMVENHNLRRAQYERLRTSKNVKIYAPDQLECFQYDASGVEVKLKSGAVIKAKLIVGADGRGSNVREVGGISLTRWDYNQLGIVCTVSHELHHNYIAHERFLPSGPFAILPLKGTASNLANRSSLVWTERKDLVPRIMELDNEYFTEEIHQRFGNFLGGIEVEGPRYTFPLALQFASKIIDRRLVLVGDAAYAMHPIAGQGLNMGLRDVAALAEVLFDAMHLGLDLAL